MYFGPSFPSHAASNAQLTISSISLGFMATSSL
jgi:hypothetical protein